VSDLENLVVGLFMAGFAAYGAGAARSWNAAVRALDADTDEGEVVRVTGIARVVGEPADRAKVGKPKLGHYLSFRGGPEPG
jgi:hypothetical protein